MSVGAFDFTNAQLPGLVPLRNSFAVDEIEADLKRLFLDLFTEHLATTAFDANVLGAPHLGTMDLVRRMVNTDGLVLLRGDREESATRYVYRAWASRNVQGRGLHFLRTYLQMQFPNSSEAYQLWQDKSVPYPTRLRREGGDGWFLTSRVQIMVDAQVVTGDQIDQIYKSIVSILPARFIPKISVSLNSRSALNAGSVGTPTMQFDGIGALVLPPESGTSSTIAACVITGYSQIDSSGQLNTN